MPILSYNETGEQVDLTPVAYKDQEWAKNIKSADDLFSQFDNAQKLMGRSIQIPTEDAKDEDWGKVYNKLGRPEKPDDYGLKMADDAADSLKQQAADLAKIFHDNGLSKKQAAKLLEGVQTISKTQLQQMTEAQTAKDAEFTTLMEKTFGDKKEEATKVTRSLIEKFAPAELQRKMQDMTPDQLTVMAAVLKGVSDTYISADDLRGLGGGSTGGAKTAEDFRNEGKKLMATDAYKNISHVDHKETVRKANEAYAEFGRLTKK